MASTTLILLLALVGTALGQTITADQVNRVLKALKRPQVSNELAEIVADGIDATVSTSNEAAMFLAQMIHESLGFFYRAEQGGPKKRYAPYYGRGFIQVTWDYNYKAFSLYLYGDDRLLRNPDLVSSSNELAMEASKWFWKYKVQPAGGPRLNNFARTSRVIQPRGTQKESTKRYSYYKVAAATLGVKKLASNK